MTEVYEVVAEGEPRWWDKSHWYRGRGASFACLDAKNIAATALVAAKVYETYEWVHFHGPRPADEPEYHVCTAEELFPILVDLAEKALNCEDEVCTGHGHLRLLAYANDEGEDRSVDFYITIGSSFADKPKVQQTNGTPYTSVERTGGVADVGK